MDARPIFSKENRRVVQLRVIPNDATGHPLKKPTTAAKHNELPSQDGCIAITPESYKAVNLQKRYDATSTEDVLQAVEKDGIHTLSLGGKSVFCHDSTWFNEYSHVHRDKRGVPINTVYFYECYQFPDYYVRWYCDQSTVDCEPKTAIPCSNGFQWKKEPVGDNGGLDYNRLVAYRGNPHDVSPAYLTFQGDQPVILPSIDSAIQLLITPA